jgi:UDP-GlcNAc:undecaprenyl-phosphate GlcNAc-1-phosphate transferase
MELAVFFLAMLISAVFTRGVRDLAIARGWVSAPSSARHVHVRPVPRLGGVAIFLALWSVALLVRWIPSHLGLSGTRWSHVTIGIMGPATIVFLLGLWDDLWHLNAYWKFGVQIVAAVLLYLNGFGISLVSSPAGGSSVGWMVGLPLTVLWVLWITNAFNLIDGLDGLAAGSALFSTLVICVIAVLSQSPAILFLSLALAGAIAGFLRYNFNPASIFLGDCGSLLIGFVLGAIALAGSQKSPTIVAVAIPLVSLGLPILDVGVAVVRRFLSRQPLFRADREHIHHRLMSRGISHKQAVLLLYGVSGGFGLLSLFLLNPNGRTLGVVLVVLGLGILVGLQQLRYHEFFELKHAATRTLTLRQTIANGVSVRKTVDALRSCETSSELCMILQNCLMPIGFDGFAFFLQADVPYGADCFPLEQVSKSNFQFFWDSSLNSSEANWVLTLGMQSNGHRTGGFALYRKNASSPLRIDLDIFTTTGFSRELALATERLQSHWLADDREVTVPPLQSSASAAGD